MRPNVFRIITCIVFVSTLAMIGCSKKGSDAPGGAAIFDSTEQPKAVAVNEPNHYIYFRPKVGDVYRYRITLTSSAGAETDDQLEKLMPKTELASSTNSYYLKQTVKAIRPDSSVEFTLSFDSITIKLDKDTTHINFSTNNPNAKKDKRFSTFAILIGENIGFYINKYGDIKEVFNTSGLVEKFIKNIELPDSANTADNIAKNRDMIKKSVESTIADYLGRTMVRFPEKPMAKDSVMTVNQEINVPIWRSVSFPMRLDSKTTMDGFQERGGKVLASFTTVTSVTPTKTGIDDPAATATLANMKANVRELVLVEDATGMLVHREIKDERGWDFTLSVKKQQDKFFKTHRNSKDLTTVDLLR